MSQDQVLIVDKPAGMTSHDVVARARRMLRQKRIGHAGTLDPLATGVLVLLTGQATKLAPYLTADDKVYSTTIRLGVATDSLDADGTITEVRALPEALAEALRAWPAVPSIEASDPHTSTASPGPTMSIAGALAVELRRTSQVPPSVSAIHVDGERAHVLSRRLGADAVVLPPRAVAVRALRVTGADAAAMTIDVELHVDKGYYVRAFARDLAASLGTVGHVSRLRRLASGAFTFEDATELLPDALRPIALTEAARRALPCVILTADGVTLARHGKALPAAAFEVPPAPDAPAAWLDPAGMLVAVGLFTADAGKVLRGFSSPLAP